MNGKWPGQNPEWSASPCLNTSVQWVSVYLAKTVERSVSCVNSRKVCLSQGLLVWICRGRLTMLHKVGWDWQDANQWIDVVGMPSSLQTEEESEHWHLVPSVRCKWQLHHTCYRATANPQFSLLCPFFPPHSELISTQICLLSCSQTIILSRLPCFNLIIHSK